VIVAGLVFFTVTYALVFPQSQMPIRVTLEKFDTTFVPKTGVYCDNEVLITTAGKTIRLPQSGQDLPWGLKWKTPQLVGFEEKDEKIYVSFAGNKYVWDGKWSTTEYEPKLVLDVDTKGLDTYSFVGINDNSLLLKDIENDFIYLPIDKLGVIEDKTIPFSREGFEGVEMGGFTYFPATPDIGRIVKIKDGKEVARSERSNLETTSIPAKIATDGQNVFAVIWNTTENTKTVAPIQVYDSNLEFVKEFGTPRQGRKPSDVEIFKSMVLLLWDDGLLEGYSKDGYLMFSESIAGDGTDMMVAGNFLFAKGKTWIGHLNVTVVKPETPIWPRILFAGAVEGETKHTIVIKSVNEPKITVKGDMVLVLGISKLDQQWRVQLLLKSKGMPAFERYETELLVDMDGLHEIVPVIYYPQGKIRKFQLFDQFAVDVETFEKLDLEMLGKMSGKLYSEMVLRQVYLLLPAPGQQIVE
jgi:hypothetical protein